MKGKRVICLLAAALLLTGCGTDFKKNEAFIEEFLETNYGGDFKILNSYMDENETDADYMCRMNVIPAGHPEYLFECSYGEKHHSEKSVEGITETHYAEGILNYGIAENMKEKLSAQFGGCYVRAALNNEVFWASKEMDTLTTEDYLARALDFNGELNDAAYTVIVNTDIYLSNDPEAEYAAVTGLLTEISETLGLGGTLTLYFRGGDTYRNMLEWYSEHLELPADGTGIAENFKAPFCIFAYDYETHQLSADCMTKEQYTEARTNKT
ncbi:MAG: hypothetical protein IKQ91_01950 [Oscillospiraceae bacterium]|nr:hypothetical protein [Oscillospiraceae bacterium]